MGKVQNKLAKKVLAKKKAQAEDRAKLKAGGGYHPEAMDEDKNPPEEVTETETGAETPEEVVDISGEDGGPEPT